jgi:hypothetical protein
VKKTGFIYSLLSASNCNNMNNIQSLSQHVGHQPSLMVGVSPPLKPVLKQLNE